MSDDELYIERYDEEDLRQLLGLQAEEYRHLQTQAFRLIRIVVAIIAVIAATVSFQLLFQVFQENRSDSALLLMIQQLNNSFSDQSKRTYH